MVYSRNAGPLILAQVGGRDKKEVSDLVPGPKQAVSTSLKALAFKAGLKEANSRIPGGAAVGGVITEEHARTVLQAQMRKNFSLVLAAKYLVKAQTDTMDFGLDLVLGSVTHHNEWNRGRT